jgi:spoIIIJ-associated protein
MDKTVLKDTVGSLLTLLSLPFDDIVISEEEDYTRADIATNDASRLIGWHGETLNALQHLSKSIMRTKENLDRSPFIVLDVDGYRRSQEERVCGAADQKADFVRRTGNRIALAPMSPYFRRVVHLYVAGHPDLQDLTTESVGEGEYRQVVLKLKDESSKAPSEDEELAPVIADDGLENLDV